MKKLLLVNYVLIAVLSCFLSGCNGKESHEPIVNMAVGLDITKEVWEKKGRPIGFDPTSAVQSSDERYYTFTNEILVAGQAYHCRFAVRSQLIHTAGAMAITDDGTHLWIYDKDGKVILSPEKNGIEKIDK